jgi:lipoprotein-releasing system permease protein
LIGSPFEWVIGLRYTRASRSKGQRNGFISFISALSVLGIALGVAALITVLSVMNGFQQQVRDRMLGVLSHIEVLAGREPLSDWQSVLAQAKRHAQVVAGAPFVSGQAMLTVEDTVRGVLVRGIDPAREREVTEFLARLSSGSLDALTPGSFSVVIGKELSKALLLGVGDKLTLIAPQGTVTPTGLVPRLRQFTIVAVYDSGHYEYDSTLVLVNIEDASRLFRIEGVSGVRLKTNNMMRAPDIANDLVRKMTGDLYIRDWSKENRNWFAAVQIEKRMMFIILTLIIAVAAFNLVSMLVMTVTDKRADIAILRTLGAAPRSIMAIFMVQGSAIGLLGTGLGVSLGVILSLNIDRIVGFVEELFGFRVLPPGIYFITQLPSDLRFDDVLTIGVVACLLAFASTLYPSWRASRVQPAQALRYE